MPLAAGEQPKDIKSVDLLIKVCSSFHLVEEPKAGFPVPSCSGNPAELNCPTCKGFKHIGICSHVLAINHILQRYNVKYALKALPKRKDRSGGNTVKPVPSCLDQNPPP